MGHRNRIGRAVVAALALAGCLTTTTTTPNGQQSSGAVAGYVQRSDGRAVVNAQVGFVLTSEPVGNTSQLYGEVATLTDSLGRFAQVFVVAVAPQNALAEIIVTPPIGSQLQSLDTVRIPVRLGNSYPPTDTTFVPIVLPAR